MERPLYLAFAPHPVAAWNIIFLIPKVAVQGERVKHRRRLRVDRIAAIAQLAASPTLDAGYSNYHKLEVSFRILPPDAPSTK